MKKWSVSSPHLLSSLVRVEHLPFSTLPDPEIERVDICHYLAPETCPFTCSMQMTHLSINWAINLEGYAWLLASKV
jgi:hypothetical protein